MTSCFSIEVKSRCTYWAPISAVCSQTLLWWLNKGSDSLPTLVKATLIYCWHSIKNTECHMQYTPWWRMHKRSVKRGVYFNITCQQHSATKTHPALASLPPVHTLIAEELLVTLTSPHMALLPTSRPARPLRHLHLTVTCHLITIHHIASIRAQRIPISLWDFIWRF